MEGIISTMCYLNERGIYHGDIRPNHILLTEMGVPKITDNGILCEIHNNYQKALNGNNNVFLSPELIDFYSRNITYPRYKVFIIFYSNINLLIFNSFAILYLILIDLF